MANWVVFLHVASVLAFMLGHGVQVTGMWAMRAEADPARMLTFFNDMPNVRGLRILLSLVIVTGVAAGFLRDRWGEGWIWASLLILAAIWLAMWRFGGAFYGMTSEAAEAAVEARGQAPSDPGPHAAYDAARRSWHTIGLTVAGVGGVTVILWLMVFKPF
jgi:hypothetical protein